MRKRNPRQGKTDNGHYKDNEFDQIIIAIPGKIFTISLCADCDSPFISENILHTRCDRCWSRHVATSYIELIRAILGNNTKFRVN